MIIAHYDYKTIHSILEPCLGQYDPSAPLREDDGTEEQYIAEQETFDEKPFDVYLHGSSAMLLAKITKNNGSLKVVISSTKGMWH